MKAYTKEWFDAYQNVFEKMYFKNEYSIYGIKISDNNRTSEEVKRIEEEYETSGNVDMRIVAWKLGRLDSKGNIMYNIDGSLSSTYGGKICNLENYLKSRDINTIYKMILNLQYDKAYQLLNNSPDNFGTVYIITLMHFISKGQIPIYDKFSHKAVKAIYAETLPSKIYVGPPPEKKKVGEVMNLLNEYIWLLDKVFGRHNIDRPLDRALWFYGHENGIIDGKIKLLNK